MNNGISTGHSSFPRTRESGDVSRLPPVPRQGQGWIPASAVVRKLRSADKRSSSFEASLREAPQDEEFHRAINGIPHAEGAPFETAASRPPQGEARLEAREAPQDEEFHRAIDGIPHAEERPLGRVSKHADADAASILCSADFLTFGH